MADCRSVVQGPLWFYNVQEAHAFLEGIARKSVLDFFLVAHLSVPLCFGCTAYKLSQGTFLAGAFEHNGALDLVQNGAELYTLVIPHKVQYHHILHCIISKSDILEINCSSIAPLDKCISQDTEPLQGAYDKI